MFSRACGRGRMNYPCIPSRFPLSYLRRPSWKMPVATNTMSNVKPAIAASRGQVNWCSNCSGTKEMKPAGRMVNSSTRTAPLKMYMGYVLKVMPGPTGPGCYCWQRGCMAPGKWPAGGSPLPPYRALYPADPVVQVGALCARARCVRYTGWCDARNSR